MKARVKLTGEIVNVYNWGDPTFRADNGDIYQRRELDFDIEDENNPNYWDKLLHQYAGMAMQRMIKTYEQMMRADIECKMDCCEYVDAKVANGLLRSHAEACAEFCIEFATALVNKLKGK